MKKPASARRAPPGRRRSPRRATRSKRSQAPSIIRVDADADGLGRVFDAYERFAKTHNVPDNVRRDVYVALEEIVGALARRLTDGALDDAGDATIDTP